MCKAMTCLFSSALVLGLLLACAAEAADPSLVAHYRLDEGAGTIAHDSSANAYDGTLLGTPQWVTGAGDAGVALAFDPTNACTGIECPRFDPTDGTGQFTFTIWALWDGTETYHHFFTKSDGWGQTTMMFQLELWGGSTSAPHFNRIGISYDPDSIPFYEMPKNEWTHLAFVYDGAEMVVYLNGVDSMGPQAAAIGPATDARTVIGVADNDQRVWTGALDDVQIYSRPLADGEVLAIMEGNVGLSTEPQPETGATDVPRDVMLGWTAGEFAATHDVYLGTVFDDVNNADRANPLGVLVSQDRTATTYDPPDPLELGRTYYWRVDEVNAPPDYTVFKGDVWSFTVEPVGYPIANITATSNGNSAAGEGPENTINGSGLNQMDQHSTNAPDMWLCTPVGAEPVYIQYEFDRVYKLHEMLVWNYNVMFELILGFGLKDVTIETSENGTDWNALADVQFAQGTAMADYTPNTVVDLGGVAARYVKLTVNAGWGMMGQFGLSEVRFLHIPVQPRQPQPASGATDVSVDTSLTWRAGREAVTHDVYLGADADSLALVDSVSQTTYTPGNLEFGGTYYWRIDEVGDADVWAGDLWNFTTEQYAVIDDMESYDDEDNCIFDTWLDGYVNGTGSTVGYFEAPFAEQTIVYSGRQSMPFAYDNSAAPFYSEAQRDFDSVDFSGNGADTLVVHFRGNPVAFLEQDDGSILMGAAGTDIWGTADEFRFAYKQLNGDGTIVARVDSLIDTDPWAKGGVMIREALDAGSKFAAVYITPGNGCRFQARQATSVAAVSDTSVATPEQIAVAAPYWVKLERTGDQFNAFYSADGAAWTAMSWNSQDVPMGGTVYIGLALTSHSAGNPSSARFSGVATTGSVTGSWAADAIGVEQPSNDPAPLYVAIEDAMGNVAVLNHPDAAAVGAATWQTWLIPYSDLAGVNLGRVAIMYIGVGDRDNPSAGGTGLLFVDDIAYGHPAAIE